MLAGLGVWGSSFGAYQLPATALPESRDGDVSPSRQYMYRDYM